MAAVLEAFPAGDQVVVLLDNLEEVMEAAAAETLTETALQEAITVLLTAPAHAVTVIATTRLTPTSLLGVEPGAQRQLRLDAGLESPDAETVLRELDGDGTLGLRDAPDDILNGLRAHTRGFPRALEAVKAILDGDPTLNPSDLLDRTRSLPEDRVVEVLVGEAYQLLDPPAQQVMQALAVFPAPVSVVGVDFLLRPFDPTTDAAPILARLVRRQLVRFHDGQYDLHPIDRDYALDQIPPGASGDPSTVFTVSALQALAADYYAQIRTPRESWRTLDDIRPQLAEFELRRAAGDYDTAATVLADIDNDYMQRWGHYRTLVHLHSQINGRISDPRSNAAHLIVMGNCHSSLGDYRQSIELYTQVLTIARKTGNRADESAPLGNQGFCHERLGDYRRAIDLSTQALTIARDTGNRDGEAAILTNLGNCHYSLGEYQQAIELHTQRLTIARETRNRDGEAFALTNLGNCHYSLGEYQEAIDLHTQSLTVARQTGNRYLEAAALDYLGRVWLASGDVEQAQTLLGKSVDVADSTGDIEPAVEARSDLARTHLEQDDPAAALAIIEVALTRPYPREEPTLLLLKGTALLQLGRITDAMQAFEEASRAADALLELHDRNVAALHAQALALAGLAVTTGETDEASHAADVFIRARAVTTAAGVTTASLQLLEQISRNDQAGILADLRAAQSL
jgi:tetratricopeptide (TPR) repeat protein